MMPDAFIHVISIHAPLAGCDGAASYYESQRNKFQSTRPLRGATCVLFFLRWVVPISIHAPLAGCDVAAEETLAP